MSPKDSSGGGRKSVTHNAQQTDTVANGSAYIKVAEIAEDLRVTPMTVYRMISAGTLPALRLGRRTYRVRRTDYETYKAGLEKEADQRAFNAAAAPYSHVPGQTEIATDGLAAL